MLEEIKTLDSSIENGVFGFEVKLWAKFSTRCFVISLCCCVSLFRRFSMPFRRFGGVPLPKKKYGNDMAKHGPYMNNIWEWYGKVG